LTDHNAAEYCTEAKSDEQRRRGDAKPYSNSTGGATAHNVEECREHKHIRDALKAAKRQRPRNAEWQRHHRQQCAIDE
jgi:hypothetical protein